MSRLALPRRHTGQAQRGVTLVEMLIGQLVGILVIGGVLGLIPPAIGMFHGANAASVLQENARLAADTLERLIQPAGYAGCHDGASHAGAIRVDAAAVSSRLAGWAFQRFRLRGFGAGEAEAVAELVGASWESGRYQPAGRPVGDVLLLQSTHGPEFDLVSHDVSGETLRIGGASTSDMAAGSILRIADCDHAATFQVATETPPVFIGGGQVLEIAYGASDSNNCTAVRTDDGVASDSGRVMLGANGIAHCRDDAGRARFSAYRFPAGSRVMALQSTLLYLGEQPDTGTPALYRLDIASTGPRPYTEALVEGVENLRFLYGIDGNDDGSPERWIGAATVNAEGMGWENVIAVRAWVMLRVPRQRGRGIHSEPLMFPDANGNLVNCRAQGADPDACPIESTAGADDRGMLRVVERTIRLRNGGGA